MKTNKNKLINLLKTGILFFGISLLLWNCEQETVFEEIQETPIAKVYKFEPKDIPTITSQIENKSRKNVFSRNSNTTEPYWIDDQNIIGAIDTLGNKSFFYRLYFNNMSANTFYNIVVTERVENDIEPFVLAYEYENGEKKSMKYYGLETFLDVLVERENKKTSNRSFNRDDRDESLSLTEIRNCGDLLKKKNSSNSQNNSGGGGGGISDSDAPGGNTRSSGGYTSFGATTINFIGGNTGGGSSSRRKVTIDWGQGTFEFPEYTQRSSSRNNDRVICPDGEIIIVENVEEDIIDNTKNDCVGDIIEKLQEKDRFKSLVPDLTGVSHLSQTVLDLFGECKNYDLTINVSELGKDSQGNPRNAQTNGIESITLDDDLVDDATQLSIAKTLIHESMHVFINYSYKIDKSSDLTVDLRKLYNIYKEDNTPKTAENLTQHQFMSQYVEALAYSLSAYDGHRQNISYYTKLSWGGLEYSDTYKALSSSEKSEIQKIIQNERYAKSDAKGEKCD